MAACSRTSRCDGVEAQPPSGAGGEQRLVAVAGAFGQPHAAGPLGGCGQRDGPLLAALAETADVGTGAEADVAAVEADQLGDPQPGLDGQQQQGTVPAAFPSGAVGCADEGVDLGRGEKRHQRLVEPFGGDGEHPLDELGVFGVAQGRVGEQRPDRGQAQVAGSWRRCAGRFRDASRKALIVSTSRSAQSRVAGCLPGALLDEHEQAASANPGRTRWWLG